MHVEIIEQSPEDLTDYARVPIAFVVRTVFDDAALEVLRRGGRATPTPMPSAYVKDYDAYPGSHPTDWPRRFHLHSWIILSAFSSQQRVGGAVVVVNDPAVEQLRDQPDIALLWDLRVATAVRHQGIGTALLQAAEEAARQRGARALRVETQNINVPACNFYQRNGFSLEQLQRDTYAEFPHEWQLLWLETLGAP